MNKDNNFGRLLLLLLLAFGILLGTLLLTGPAVRDENKKS